MKPIAAFAFACVALSGCTSDPYAPDAPTKAAFAFCDQHYARKSVEFGNCISHETQARTPKYIGSGIDAVTSIQNGTAPPNSCAKARNSPTGYSTTICNTKP